MSDSMQDGWAWFDGAQGPLADAEVRHKSFYYRYERWILPVVVMFTGLLVVVYGGQNLVMHGAEWQESLNAMLQSLFG